MINEEVRNIVETELQVDETLFWAEKTKPYEPPYSYFKNLKLGENETRLALIFGAFLFIMIVPLALFSLKAVFVLAAFITAYCALLYWIKVQGDEEERFQETYYDGAYALTNQRFFVLNKSCTGFTYRDSSSLTATETNGTGELVFLMGLKSWWVKNLPNPTQSSKFINSQLGTYQ